MHIFQGKRTELNRVEWKPVDAMREAGSKLGDKLQNMGQDINKLVDGLFAKTLDEVNQLFNCVFVNCT